MKQLANALKNSHVQEKLRELSGAISSASGLDTAGEHPAYDSYVGDGILEQLQEDVDTSMQALNLMKRDEYMDDLRENEAVEQSMGER